MRTSAALLLVLMFCAGPAFAQTTGEQKAADIASWAVWGVATAVDVAECRFDVRDKRCYVMAGVRNGVVAGATYGLKKAIRSPRPCRPHCGTDDPYSNVPSGHVAFTAATLPRMSDGVGPRFVVAASATVIVGALRMKANKHDLVGVASGAAVGWAASFIR